MRLVLSVTLALLAGCSRTGSNKTLTIAVNAGVEGSALKAAAQEWGGLRNTRIQVVELPYANLFEKESLDLTSRTGAYDVIMMDDPWFPKLVADIGLTPPARPARACSWWRPLVVGPAGPPPPAPPPPPPPPPPSSGGVAVVSPPPRE